MWVVEGRGVGCRRRECRLWREGAWVLGGGGCGLSMNGAWVLAGGNMGRGGKGCSRPCKGRAGREKRD